MPSLRVRVSNIQNFMKYPCTWESSDFDETWSADRGWSRIITGVDLAAQGAFTVGKTGCQSGEKLIFWKVAIYHLWGTFISLIPHYIMKSAKSNQFSGKFEAQYLFLSCWNGKSWAWEERIRKMSFFWNFFEKMSKFSLFCQFYGWKHLYITKF